MQHSRADGGEDAGVFWVRGTFCDEMEAKIMESREDRGEVVGGGGWVGVRFGRGYYISSSYRHLFRDLF